MNGECHCGGSCDSCKTENEAQDSQSSPAQFRRNGELVANPFGESEVEVAANGQLQIVNCGGPGSGIPGPCPKGEHNAHLVARAHAAASANVLAKAATNHSKLGTKSTEDKLKAAHDDYISKMKASLLADIAKRKMGHLNPEPAKGRPKPVKQAKSTGGKAPAGGSVAKGKGAVTGGSPSPAPAPSSKSSFESRKANVEKVHKDFVGDVVDQYLNHHGWTDSKGQEVHKELAERSQAGKPRLGDDALRRHIKQDVLEKLRDPSPRDTAWLAEHLPAVADTHAATAEGRGISKPHEFVKMAKQRKDFGLSNNARLVLGADGQIVLAANAYGELTGGRWVTTEGDHHLYIKDGEIVAGNPHVVAALSRSKGSAKGKKGEADGIDSGSGHERGGGSAGGRPAKAGKPVAGEAGSSGDAAAGSGGQAAGGSAGQGSAPALPKEELRHAATLSQVNDKLDKFGKLFAARGQHEVSAWLGKLREHVNAVGVGEALKGLGESKGRGDSKLDVEYGGEKAGWDSMSQFAKDYLGRHGITSAHYGTTGQGDTSKTMHASIAPSSRAPGEEDFEGIESRGSKKGGFEAKLQGLKDKLEESKHLPGLEKSEDLGKLMGKGVTHLTQEVVDKLDSHYGKNAWLVKPYGDEAYAGHGIFFPQKIAAMSADARASLHDAEQGLKNYGFSIARDGNSGKAVGLIHESGDHYPFGSEEYKNTIYGHAKELSDKAAAAADAALGPKLPERFGVAGSFMAQPAFKAAGVSDADRAAGTTIAPGEGRVHVVTRNGKAEIIPHTTWIKGDHLPVVLENDDTRAMAKAAQEAIDALPHGEKQGQMYAPDIIKTEDGYRVVEANPSNSIGGSGYLGDNPFIIDSFVSHLTGRDPQHVRFIKSLLTTRKKGKVENMEHPPSFWRRLSNLLGITSKLAQAQELVIANKQRGEGEDEGTCPDCGGKLDQEGNCEACSYTANLGQHQGRHHQSGQFLNTKGSSSKQVHSAVVSGHKTTYGETAPDNIKEHFEPASDELDEDDAQAELVGTQPNSDGRNLVRTFSQEDGFGSEEQLYPGADQQETDDAEMRGEKKMASNSDGGNKLHLDGDEIVIANSNPEGHNQYALSKGAHESTKVAEKASLAAVTAAEKAYPNSKNKTSHRALGKALEATNYSEHGYHKVSIDAHNEAAKMHDEAAEMHQHSDELSTLHKVAAAAHRTATEDHGIAKDHAEEHGLTPADLKEYLSKPVKNSREEHEDNAREALERGDEAAADEHLRQAAKCITEGFMKPKAKTKDQTTTNHATQQESSMKLSDLKTLAANCSCEDTRAALNHSIAELEERAGLTANKGKGFPPQAPAAGPPAAAPPAPAGQGRQGGDDDEDDQPEDPKEKFQRNDGGSMVAFDGREGKKTGSLQVGFKGEPSEYKKTNNSAKNQFQATLNWYRSVGAPAVVVNEYVENYRQKRAAKKAEVQQLVGHISNDGLRDLVGNKLLNGESLSLDEHKLLASRRNPVANRYGDEQPLYVGAGDPAQGITDNAEPDVLEMPTMNWGENVALEGDDGYGASRRMLHKLGRKIPS